MSNSSKIIRLSKSCIGENEKKAVLRVLENEFLGMGEEVQKFELNLKSFFDRETVCVSTGTAALQLALQAVGIAHGDEVLVPSLTYLASFQAITALGATPVACDILEENFCIDCNDAEKRITKQTKVIMPVHYSGGVGKINEVYELATKYNLRVIEDSAHAFGSVYENKKVGSFGDIACFSFDGIKNITSGEGGCVVTNDKYVIDFIKDARLLGVENDTEKRFAGKRSWNFDVKFQGWRYHMSNIMAAIGIAQLNRFQEFSKKRQELAMLYDNLFENEKRIITIKNDYNKVVPHIYVIRIQNLSNRIDFQEKLLKKNIQTGIHYKPNHLLTFFQKPTQNALIVVEKIANEILTLPLHPDLSKEDVIYVVKSLIEVLND